MKKLLSILVVVLLSSGVFCGLAQECAHRKNRMAQYKRDVYKKIAHVVSPCD